jgi:hypothetical protein
LAVAAPIAPAAPVTTAIWPASGGSAAVPSLACSSAQYSMSNMSACESDSKRPIASASVMVAIAASAMSAAMRASCFERPSPNSPTPGTSATRGAGSSMVFVSPTRALLVAK